MEKDDLPYLSSDRIEELGISGEEPDMVNHPPHYNKGGIESIDVIEAFKLGFCAGNAVKYILRYQYKGSALQDLEKAHWYLTRLIKQVAAGLPQGE